MDVVEKDKDRQLLIQIAANSKHLDSLPQDDIAILTELFHLERSDDEREAFHRLRNKLCEILIIEREHYEDYLKLPKFKRIKLETIDKITLFWEFIWLTFVHAKQEQKAAKKNQHENMGTRMPGPMEPNLNCFNYFPPYQPITQPKIPYSPYPYFYNFPNYQFPQFYPNNSTLKFPPFQMPKPPNIQMQERINSHQSEVVFKNEHISESQNKKNNTVSNIINVAFLHCVCEGKSMDQKEEFFTCFECYNCFHLSCIKYRKVLPKACPQCTLTKQNMFAQAITRPIKIGWLQLNKQEYFVTKIHFNQEEMKIFTQCLAYIQSMDENKALWVEFSILKIIDGVLGNKKQPKTSFIISSSELKKVQTRKWIQLKLKQVTQECLVSYVISLTKMRQRQEIIEKYKSMGMEVDSFELWDKQEKKQKKKLTLNLMHPKTNRMIELPVRGQLCDHLECQDLFYFYNIFKLAPFDSNKLQCSYCRHTYTPYSKFITDKTIYRMLQGRQQENKSTKLEMVDFRKLEWVADEMYDGGSVEQAMGEQMESEV